MLRRGSSLPEGFPAPVKPMTYLVVVVGNLKSQDFANCLHSLWRIRRLRKSPLYLLGHFAVANVSLRKTSTQIAQKSPKSPGSRNSPGSHHHRRHHVPVLPHRGQRSEFAYQ